MTQALAGVRIADFSHVMAGPFATHFLGAMGAEVIKVEGTGRGDPMRDYGPDKALHGLAPGFVAANCGKKSVALDLKSAAGKDAARRLIAASDVVLENFRPGVMDRLGLGHDDARKLKTDIIYCSVSGYGQTGPLKDYPAIDNIVQATSGLASLNGEPDGPWMRAGFPVVDAYTGTLAAMAILAALVRKGATGDGQRIDLAMFDAAMVLMAPAAVPYLMTGKMMPRTGNTGYSGQPTAAMYVCKDGRQVSLGVVQQDQYERLCKAMGRADLLSDPRFRTPAERLAASDALKAELAPVFATKDGAEWEKLLSEAGAPCGLLRNIEEATDMPGLQQRNLIGWVPGGFPPGTLPQALNAGFVCDQDGPQLQGPPPRLGQHTREVLGALGFDAAEINTMISRGEALAG